MARAAPCPADVAALLGAYRATCGSTYTARWQTGALHLSRRRAGYDEEPAYPYDADELRRQIRWNSLIRIQ